MQNYLDMTMERIDKATTHYHAIVAKSPEYAETIRQAQWAMVNAGKADMDAAWIIAIEQSDARRIAITGVK